MAANRTRNKLRDTRGGRREGAGRPTGRPNGALSTAAVIAREVARTSGALPHEILLRIARGYPVTLKDDRGNNQTVYPNLTQMMDAAKAAAPYYAPKMSTIEVIQNLTDDDLDTIIKSAAAEIGVDVGVTRKGEESKDQTTERPSAGTIH